MSTIIGIILGLLLLGAMSATPPATTPASTNPGYRGPCHVGEVDDGAARGRILAVDVDPQRC